MLAVAAIGGVLARGESGKPLSADEQRRAGWRRLAGHAPLLGLGFTAATFVLMQVFAGQQPDCGGAGEGGAAPGWTDYLAWAAVGTSIGAGVLGSVGLLASRWVLALVCLVVNPALLIFLDLSTCVGY